MKHVLDLIYNCLSERRFKISIKKIKEIENEIKELEQNEDQQKHLFHHFNNKL